MAPLAMPGPDNYSEIATPDPEIEPLDIVPEDSESLFTSQEKEESLNLNLENEEADR